VRVSDNGVGIPSDMLVRVFDMFTQAHRSMERAQGGLGIGLTLVKRLAELHGGSIQAESAGANQGSTFTLRLPLAAASTDSSQARNPEPTPNGVSLRVLVVDDNVDAADSLGMLLQLQGHDVRLVHDGLDALAAVREFRPDAILLDLGLPGIDGYEVARQLRMDVELRQPRLIALTGWGSEDDRRRALAAGFDHHLVKPVDGARLECALAVT
jgi:CheY-like chemotaxis protein